MTPLPFRSESRTRLQAERLASDPVRRRMIYGRLRSMDEDRSLLSRIFDRF